MGLAVLEAHGGCYTGSARDVSPRNVAAEPGWQIVPGVPFVHQRRDDDCGAAALAMVLGYWGRPVSLDAVVADVPPSQGGITAGALRDEAKRHGMQAFLVSGTMQDLVDGIGHGRPVLVGLAKPVLGQKALAHYEVVVGLNRARKKILTWDPAQGLRENTAEGFAREWVPTRQVTLVIFPAPAA